MKDRNKHSGMTFTEVLVAFSLGALLVGIVLSMWYFAYKNWTLERIRTKLRTNLEIAMERLKEEARLSSATYMSFYKAAGATEYTAISFPRALPNASGFLALSGNDIFWDRSVIYHVYDNPSTGNTELRRTEFTNNNAILTNRTNRETQLSQVVTNGSGSGALNSANATTLVIFENAVDFVISPQSQLFDGYNATEIRSDKVEFGSIRLAPGDHDLKFEVVGQNPLATGCKLGIDSLAITPSGCFREIETYTPQATSGDTSSLVYAFGWGGNYYYQYNADTVGTDYVTFRLYYDEWRESNFGNSVLQNTVLKDASLRVVLATPKEGGAGSWQSTTQTGVDGADYPQEAGEPALTNVAIRNILASNCIDVNGNLARVKFIAHSAADLTINEAYIAERSADDDATGAAAQLFFSDSPVLAGESEPDAGGSAIGGTVGVTPIAITIPAGYYAWSNWAVFPIDETKDYFVTFSTPAGNFTYWKPETAGAVNSYYSATDSPSANAWTASTASVSIYGVEELASWSDIGTITSAIYDTKLSDPSFGQISWSESVPSGSNVVMKARSSDDPYMAGATAWSAITGSSLNPHNLSIGTGRYVQFQATMTTASPYTAFPWIDNVTSDWPGDTKICDISGYFTQKPDYGIIKLTVDGNELIKGLEFTMAVSEIFRGEIYEEFLSVEVEPRNTGR